MSDLVTAATAPVLTFAGSAGRIGIGVGGSALAISTVHVLLALLLPRLLPSWASMTPAVRSELLVQVVWLLCCTPLPFMYALGLPHLYATPDTRWHGATAVVERALVWHLGSTWYEAAVFAWHRKPAVYQLHHVIVLHAYGLALWTGSMQFWAAWCGLVEFSNPCVSVLKVMVLTNVGRGSAFEKLNGVLLWLSYLLVRVLSLPALLALFAHDARTHRAVTWAAPASVPLSVLRLSTPLSAGAIWAISLVWFSAIHHGLVKALRGDDPVAGSQGPDAVGKDD